MRTYSVALFTFNSMAVFLEEGLDLQGARNEIARRLRVKRRAGMEVAKVGKLQYECMFPEYGVSDGEGILCICEHAPRYGSCRECGADLENTGRDTHYCPSCDTCEECGCPNADGFAHYAGCEVGNHDSQTEDE